MIEQPTVVSPLLTKLKEIIGQLLLPVVLAKEPTIGLPVHQIGKITPILFQLLLKYSLGMKVVLSSQRCPDCNTIIIYGDHAVT
jgi:hypothetical protein